MNILVTGGAGYVGSICAEVLLARGHQVFVLDNLVEGHRAAVPPAATFWECDLADRAGLQRLLDSQPLDAVMHFAGEALVEKSVREPSTFYFANVACGIQLLDAMVRRGLRDIVFSSTAAVYGEPQRVPIPEDHPKDPINPYGCSKLVFEQVLEDYRRYTGLRYVALRYFNAAGASPDRGEAHRKETHLIPRLLDVALGRADQFHIYGTDYPTPDGTCLRDYVHVLDIAEAHVLALERIEEVSGQAFNVGNSRGYSIREVLDTARRVVRRPIRTVEGPRRAGDPAVLVARHEKIRHDLGWEPRNSSLENIVETAWRWKQRFPAGYAHASSRSGA